MTRVDTERDVGNIEASPCEAFSNHQSSLVLLDRRKHMNWRVSPEKIYAKAAGLRLLPVVLSELPKLIVDFPIVISKHAETGQFMLSALLGFYDNDCLFVEENSWQSVYVPLQLQRQPFFLATHEGSDLHASVMLDSAHPALVKSTGHEQYASSDPIFVETGEASERLTEATLAMQQIMVGEPDTQQFLKTLVEHELIEPMQLQICFESNDEVTLNGLYTINETNVSVLSDEVFLQLRQLGYLHFMSTLSSSLAHIYPLIHRQNMRQHKSDHTES